MKQKIRRRKMLLLLLAAVLLLSCFGCGGKQEDDAPDDAGQQEETASGSDGKFTINYAATDSMNPYLAGNTLNLTAGQLVYETLTEVDETFTARPKLFTAWTTEDNAEWTFTVDTSRVFHDGHLLTPADVLYSLQYAKNSDLYSARLHAVQEVTAPDESTVCIKLSAANSQLPALLNVPVLENNASGSYPAGTGPYRYAGDGASLVKFENHPDAASVPVDTVYLQEFVSMESIIDAFEDSLLDLAMNDPTGGMDLSFGGIHETRQYSTTNLQYVGINTNSTFFSAPERRAALQRAIDREHAVSLMQDCAVASALPVHPVSPLYNEKLAESVSYDLEACKRALDACDVMDYDGDGMREMRSGDNDYQEIRLSFLVCSDNIQKNAIVKKMKEDLTGVGLTVQVTALPWEDYMRALKNGGFDLYYGEVKLTADFDLSRLLSGGGALNYGGVTNPEYAEKIRAYLEAPAERRAEACDAMLQYILENAPILPVCFEKHEVCTHRGVVGGFAPTQYNLFHNFTNWTIDAL